MEISFEELKGRFPVLIERILSEGDENDRNIEELTELAAHFRTILENYITEPGLSPNNESRGIPLLEIVELFIQLSELSYHNEILQSPLLPLWIPYVKFIKRFPEAFNPEQSNQLIVLLISYCTDGFQIELNECQAAIEKAKSTNSVPSLDESLPTFNLLVTFIQRLSVSLYLWKKNISEENFSLALLVLFQFYGFLFEHLPFCNKFQKYIKICLQSFIKSFSRSYEHTQKPKSSTQQSSQSLISQGNKKDSQDNINLSISSPTGSSKSGSDGPEISFQDYLSVDWSLIVNCFQNTTDTPNNNISFYCIHGIQCFIVQFWGNFFQLFNLHSIEYKQSNAFFHLTKSTLASLQCFIYAHAFQQNYFTEIKLNVQQNNFENQLAVLENLLFYLSEMHAKSTIFSRFYSDLLVRQ